MFLRPFVILFPAIIRVEGTSILELLLLVVEMVRVIGNGNCSVVVVVDVDNDGLR